MSESSINSETNISPVWPATESGQTNNRRKEKPIIRENMPTQKAIEQDKNITVDENGHIDTYA